MTTYNSFNDFTKAYPDVYPPLESVLFDKDEEPACVISNFLYSVTKGLDLMTWKQVEGKRSKNPAIMAIPLRDGFWAIFDVKYLGDDEVQTDHPETDCDCSSFKTMFEKHVVSISFTVGKPEPSSFYQKAFHQWYTGC